MKLISSIMTKESSTHEFITWSDGSVSIEDPLYQFEQESKREHVNLEREDIHVLVDMFFDTASHLQQ